VFWDCGKSGLSIGGCNGLKEKGNAVRRTLSIRKDMSDRANYVIAITIMPFALVNLNNTKPIFQLFRSIYFNFVVYITQK
jgi:hypothetical protein